MTSWPHFRQLSAILGFPVDTVVKNPPPNAGDGRRYGFEPWARKIPRRKKRQPTPVFFPGKSHGQRSLAGSSPWGCKELATTEHTHTLSNTDSTLIFLSQYFPILSKGLGHPWILVSKGLGMGCLRTNSLQILRENCI